jgi:hypothetical protein
MFLLFKEACLFEVGFMCGGFGNLRRILVFMHVYGMLLMSHSMLRHVCVFTALGMCVSMLVYALGLRHGTVPLGSTAYPSVLIESHTGYRFVRHCGSSSSATQVRRCLCDSVST